MTTLTATLEDFWEDLNLPQSPFSALETFPDSDTSSEGELEEASPFSIHEVEEAQEHIACALESALHEALAKYSVNNSTKESSNISEFWNGWVDDIEIDEEINATEDDPLQEEDSSKKLSDSTPPVVILPTPIPVNLQPLPQAVTEPVTVMPTVELRPEKSKRRSGKRSPATGKSKKRKANEITEEKKKKKFSSSTLKEVFRLEQVLKIKTVDQDCENEEVDIGDIDSTTWNG